MGSSIEVGLLIHILNKPISIGFLYPILIDDFHIMYDFKFKKRYDAIKIDNLSHFKTMLLTVVPSALFRDYSYQF